VSGVSIELDRWLAQPTVRTHHRRAARGADCATLWAAASTVRVGESGLLGRLIRWRVPGTAAEQTYREMFTSAPFVALEEGEHHLLAGLCGRIWTARPSLARLERAEDFREWSEPGTARVLFAQWVLPTTGGCELVSEVRVDPIDRAAQLRLRGIWPLISRFQGLIGNEPLRLAAARAEALQRAMAGRE
jgi:hypothetical protein